MKLVFPSPVYPWYNTILGSKLIYTCCHILDALMDTILALVDICNTASKALPMSPEKQLYGYFLHSFNLKEIRRLMWNLLVLD